ncbi:MAG: nitric oxide reductase, partial [Chromatiales bacterium]|nr:nitric oxide reductase [Chromatiales bacterium]
MEEWVGKVWHKLITRAAETRYPEEAVTLDEVSQRVGVLFRALGGDGGLRVSAAEASSHGARRSWLQRIAGSNSTVELAWRDDETLRLPPQIDIFPQRDLNLSLYRWLAALAARQPHHNDHHHLPWLLQNQRLSRELLTTYPGLRPLYEQLLEAQLTLRPDPATLPDDEAQLERAIQQALHDPGSVVQLPPCQRPPQPVYLWLHPDPPVTPRDSPLRRDDPDDPQGGGSTFDPEEQRRRRAERTEAPKENQGLLAMRMET